MKETSWENLPKAFDISSTTAPMAPETNKSLAILSPAIVERSAVKLEDLKSDWKSLNWSCSCN